MKRWWSGLPQTGKYLIHYDSIEQGKATNQRLPLPVESEIIRGVKPEILLEQIRNTIPFIFEQRVPSPITRAIYSVADDPTRELSHIEYFQLCVSGHYATVASFIPTDVDNQIRFRLWHPKLDPEVLFSMARWSLSIQAWDSSSFSARHLPVNEVDTRALSGHDGEWFTVIAAAYGVARKRDPELAMTILDRVALEIGRHQQFLEFLWKKQRGIDLLIAITITAHNLGDLLRVIDMWNLPPEDPMRKLATVQGLLAFIGGINQQFMVPENHRHFALRKIKPLRRDRKLLLPIGPFLDDWGRSLLTSQLLNELEIVEVVTALIDGWMWMEKHQGKGPVGYARAIKGITEAYPGGEGALLRALPRSLEKILTGGKLRESFVLSQQQFEQSWDRRALKAMAHFPLEKSRK